MCLGRSFSLVVGEILVRKDVLRPQLQLGYFSSAILLHNPLSIFFGQMTVISIFHSTTQPATTKFLIFVCLFLRLQKGEGTGGRLPSYSTVCTARANFPFLAARCSLLLVQPYGWWWWWCGVPLVAAITRAVYAQCPPICYAASPAFYTQSIPAQIRCPHCLVSDRYRPFPLHPGYGGKGLPNPLHTQEGAIAG